MSQPAYPIKVEEEDGVLIFLPEGDLGALSWTTDQQTMYHLLERVEATANPRVVIDMSGLAFADSSLLAVLVAVWKRVTGRGGKMVLACVPPEISEVLRYTKLDSIWVCHLSRQQAVEAVKA